MNKTHTYERFAAVRATFEALDEDDAMLVTMAAEEITVGVARLRIGGHSGLGEVLALEVVAALGMFLNERMEREVDRGRGVCYDDDRAE